MNLPLWETDERLIYLYELTMMQGYFKNPTNQTVIFDMFYRESMRWRFAVCAGLEQIIEYVRDLHFSPDDIDYLRSLHILKTISWNI